MRKPALRFEVFKGKTKKHAIRKFRRKHGNNMVIGWAHKDVDRSKRSKKGNYYEIMSYRR